MRPERISGYLSGVEVNDLEREFVGIVDGLGAGGYASVDAGLGEAGGQGEGAEGVG